MIYEVMVDSMVIFVKKDCESVKTITNESELYKLLIENGADVNVNYPLLFLDMDTMKDKIHEVSSNIGIKNLDGLFFCDVAEFHENYLINDDNKIVTVGDSLYDSFYGVNLCKGTLKDLYFTIVLNTDEKGYLMD